MCNSLTYLNSNFVVHHAQLDRFWYEWQMKDPETRFSSFESLDDSLEPFGIKIQQAMDPRKLCCKFKKLL